jgi:protein MpaA
MALHTTSWRLGLAVAMTLVVSSGCVVGAHATNSASLPRVKTVTSEVLAWRHAAASTVTIGHSAAGRALVALRQGSPDAPNVVVLLGQTHGNEPRGIDVVREARRLVFPDGVQVWTISTMNPDGSVARTRVNARHVDLNRNFPYLWHANPNTATYFPGVRAASEPETKALMAFLNQLRPDLVVSLHQAFRAIDVGPSKARRWVDLLSIATGLPIKNVPCNGVCRGTMTGWYNASFEGAAITAELPRRVSATQAQIYARAVRTVAAALVAANPAPAPSGSPMPTGTPTPSVTPVPPTTGSPSPAP